MTGKGHEETFWHDCNVLNFEKGLGYTGVWIWEKSANLYLTFVHYTACECTLKIKKMKPY